jgi:hypothetical protein
MLRDNTGRLLISVAALVTAVAPVRADWNDSHVFSSQWSPHARFHGVSYVGMAVTLAITALALLWGRPPQPATTAAAAMIPIAYWGPFFLAPLVPGTALEDRGHPVPRLAGVPANLLGAAAGALSAATGWYLDSRLRGGH